MRKGFEEMELYEKYSYQPERLEIKLPRKAGISWRAVVAGGKKWYDETKHTDCAYQKPLTAVEISRVMGIPTAYIENAIEDLTSSELMKQVNNKYFTDFMIAEARQLLKA